MAVGVFDIDGLAGGGRPAGDPHTGIEAQDFVASQGHFGPQFVAFAVQQEDAGAIAEKHVGGFAGNQIEQRAQIPLGVHFLADGQDGGELFVPFLRAARLPCVYEVYRVPTVLAMPNVELGSARTFAENKPFRGRFEFGGWTAYTRDRWASPSEAGRHGCSEEHSLRSRLVPLTGLSTPLRACKRRMETGHQHPPILLARAFVTRLRRRSRWRRYPALSCHGPATPLPYGQSMDRQSGLRHLGIHGLQPRARTERGG
jgi:hypothetical protein